MINWNNMKVEASEPDPCCGWRSDCPYAGVYREDAVCRKCCADAYDECMEAMRDLEGEY